MASSAHYDTGITNTAYLTALYRAVESERPDALFHDPYARRMAGEQGTEIERLTPRLKIDSWGVAVRTAIFDAHILRLIEHEGVDTVLNLAAGLDTRPYRLQLPSSTRWIEIDLPPILEYKERLLADEQPTCTLERIGMDLLDVEARQACFTRINSQAQRVVLLTEGFLSYLYPKQVRALADDAFAQSTFRWWITEFLPSYVMVSGRPGVQGGHALGEERMHFAPEEGVKFFLPSGWHVAEYRSFLGAARRLKRKVPLGWLVGFLEFVSGITSDDPKTYRHTGGFLLLERAEKAEELQ